MNLNLAEYQLAGQILEILDNVQDIEEGKNFINTYIKSYNRMLSIQGYDPLDGKQVMRFICSVDPRFNNMV